MTTSTEELREEVRRKYAEAAEAASKGSQGSCGSGSCCGTTADADFGQALYDAEQRDGLPEAAALASLGCGNPTAVADLREGETVLDLGSGGGIDVLLSAKRVGSTGKAYGLDMTDEMLALARENQAKSGLTNVEFLKGEIENIPLPDNSVDVIISNCVINLSADKDRVLGEAFRVLKPGGRATFVMGNSCLRGVFVRNSAAVLTAAEFSGLTLIGETERALPNQSRYLPMTSTSLGKRMRTETVLSFSRV